MKKQSDDVRVRPATEVDAPNIASIHMNSRAVTMPYLPVQKRTYAQVVEWAESVLLKTCSTWVAERKGEILGYAALNKDTLDHLYLHPTVRRSGIGSLLLDEVKRHSRGRVTLHVFEQNTDAIAFYRYHGFNEVSVSDGSDNMEHLPSMTMRWVKTR